MPAARRVLRVGRPATRPVRSWLTHLAYTFTADAGHGRADRSCAHGLQRKRDGFAPASPQVLPDIGTRGWDGVLVPMVRFWEGERSRDRILLGVADPNERDLVAFVFDTYFAPLLARQAQARTPGGGAADAEAVAAAFFGRNRVKLVRIARLRLIYT
jgi:hypothetical protein